MAVSGYMMAASSPVLPSGICLEALLETLRPLAWGASDILRAYARGQAPPGGCSAALDVREGDEGPVSAADLAVNVWLLDGLKDAFPSAPWTLLSEETAKQQLGPGEVLEAEWYWLLDPLDGTRDFLNGTGEYAVHLALLRGRHPVLGVVLLPEPQELWFGILAPQADAGEAREGAGEAWCETRSGERRSPRFSDRQQPSDLVLVASRNHRDQRLEQLVAAMGPRSSLAIGSVGGKVATILRGEADLYISLSAATAPKDWDMAAPEVVLRAAGGGFSHADGRALTYNNGDLRQAGCLIASHGLAHRELCSRATAALALIDPDFAP